MANTMSVLTLIDVESVTNLELRKSHRGLSRRLF